MDEDPRIELASVRAKLDAIQQSIEDMKASISTIVNVDKTVVELKLRLKTNEEKVSEAVDRVEALEKRQANSSAYLNKIRGGVALLAAVWTLVQAIILAGASWVLSTVIDTSQNISVLQESVSQLSSEQLRIRDLIEQARK